MIRMSIKGRKGKEEYLYSAFSHQGTHKAPTGMDHTVLPANNTMPAFPSWAFTRWHDYNNWGSKHPVAAHYTHLSTPKGWKAELAWLVDL